MSAFPFIGGSYNARSPNFDAQRTINLYPEASGSGSSKSPAMLVGAPGLKLWSTLPTLGVRGALRLTATLSIVVAGASVYSVTNAGAFTLIGAIDPGLTPVSMASNGTTVMLVTGPFGYFIDIASLALTLISDAGFTGADQVDVIDGFFVWNTPGTAQFQISGLYATSIDPLDFATVEGGPGNLVSLIVDHTELWLFKEGSARVFFNAGAADFPLEPIQGAYIEQGCAAKYSVCQLDNTVVWLTADERGQGTVQKAVGYTPQRISTHALEFALASYSRIDDAVAYTYQQEGHLFYVLTLPTAGATWAYDTATQEWCERAYRDPVSGKLGRHRSNCHMAFAGMNIVGDWQNGNLYSLDLNTYTDNGDILPAIRTCPHIAEGNAWQFFAKLWIDMQTGVGLSGAPYVPAGGGGPGPTTTVSVDSVAAQFPFAGAWELPGVGFSASSFPGSTESSSQTGAVSSQSIFTGTLLIAGALTEYGFASPATGPVVLIALQGTLAQTFFTQVIITPAGGSPQTLASASAALNPEVPGYSGNSPVTGMTIWAWQITSGAVPNYFADGVASSVEFIGPSPPVTAASGSTGTDPKLTLEWSDDGGASFPNQMTVCVGKIGERKARANFRRLGKSRDRVWRVTMTDPVKRVFIGADVVFTVGS